jgi:hypothetical protein
MRWIRTNLAFGTRLALLALAIQLLVSFSHVHLDDIAQASGFSTVKSRAASGASQPSPAPDREPLCPICVLLQLSAAAVHPVAPALPLPDRVDWIRPDVAAAQPLLASPRLSFNARAPPPPRSQS